MLRWAFRCDLRRDSSHVDWCSLEGEASRTGSAGLAHLRLRGRRRLDLVEAGPHLDAGRPLCSLAVRCLNRPVQKVWPHHRSSLRVSVDSAWVVSRQTGSYFVLSVVAQPGRWPFHLAWAVSVTSSETSAQVEAAVKARLILLQICLAAFVQHRLKQTLVRLPP